MIWITKFNRLRYTAKSGAKLLLFCNRKKKMWEFLNT